VSNCAAIREELEALHYGDLEAAERGPVEAHLGQCAACRAALEAVRETAGSLDRLTVPEPSELDWARFETRLEARISPLRARRFAVSVGGFSRFGRVAAAFLIGGLSALSAGLMLETHRQSEVIATLGREVADSAWQAGDIERYVRLVKVSPAQMSPVDHERIAAAKEVEPDVAKKWALARNEKDEEASRKRVADFIASYPKHPLADQAWVAFQTKGLPKLPPIDRVVLHPIPLIPTRLLQGEGAEAACRKEIDRLRAGAAEAGDSKVAAWALFRAGRVAEENLKEAPLAIDLYDQAARVAPGGPIHDEAVERAAKLK
jgi:hypothetical protein